MRLLALMMVLSMLCACISQDHSDGLKTTTTIGGKTTTRATTTTLEQTLNQSSLASAFIDKGCLLQERYPGIQNLNCSKLGLEERYSCKEIRVVSEHLFGLKLEVPIAECMFVKRDWDSPEGLVHHGCMLPYFNKYLIIDGGEFKILSTQEEFTQFFAPVETKEEALSLAVALTGSYPMYDTNVPEGYVASSKKIVSTYVDDAPRGFIVRLFDYQMCGCGPHPYYTVEYLVSRAGNVTEIYREEIYRNPEEDGLCVD